MDHSGRYWVGGGFKVPMETDFKNIPVLYLITEWMGWRYFYISRSRDGGLSADMCISIHAALEILKVPLISFSALK